MVDKEFVSTPIEGLEVNKTEVSSGVKGIHIPIVCIPASEYMLLLRTIKAINKSFKEYIDNISCDMYSCSDESTNVGTAIYERYNETLDHLNIILDYPYNEDCNNAIKVNKQSKKL